MTVHVLVHRSGAHVAAVDDRHRIPRLPDGLREHAAAGAVWPRRHEVLNDLFWQRPGATRDAMSIGRPRARLSIAGRRCAALGSRAPC